jgi:hypothetical protein
MGNIDRLPFGKTIKEYEAEQNAVTPTEEVKTEPTVIDPVKKGETVKTEKIEAKTEPIKTTWLDDVNANFKTEFKTPDEFKSVLDKAKKADEYEPKFTEYEKSKLKYEDELKKLNSSLIEAQNPLTYFSSQDAFVAEQLKKQRKDLDSHTLGEIVSNNTDSMSDIDVLIKNELLKNPKLIGREKGAEGLILKRYGIDPSIPKEEWDITTQNEILVAASDARKQWNELKATVKMPEIATPEQREAALAKSREDKSQQLTPLKETFSKFDKFTLEIEPGKVLDVTVPDEYKEELPKMFEDFFIKGGVEVTKEALADIESLKTAIFLKNNIKQIYKVIEGDVETRMRAERDALLNNTNPTNTKTAAEVETDEAKNLSNKQGFGKMLGNK